MPSIVIKSSSTDVRDCEIQWEIDFAKMTLKLQAGFISPTLLLDFMWQLPHKDDRLVRTGIVGAVQITKRFDVRLTLPSGTTFKLFACQPAQLPDSRQEPLQLEFFEVTKESSP